MADKEVKIVLTAEDNISSVLKKVTDHLGENGMGQAVTAVSTSFLAFEKVLSIVSGAIGKVYDQIASGVNDAAEAENVNKRLAMSMAAVGEYTEKSFNDIQAWAGALETSTGVSDEAFRSLVSLGLQQGMNAETAKKAAEAALNLASATGEDMNSAFQQMSITLQGTSGRLGKMVPELRNLTKEELENGAAIDIISKKYAGFAGNAASSFTGAMTKLDSQIGNVKESFGRIIAQNPIIIAGIEKLGDKIGEIAAGMEEFATYILNNAEDIKIMAGAFLAASVGVGAYLLAINAAAIGTALFAAKTAIMSALLVATPFGQVALAVGALTAGLYYLYKNFDMVAGAVKVGLGYALQAVTMQLQMFLTGLSKVVGFFNADWAKAIDNMNSKIDSVSKNLIENGKAQMDAAKAAKKSAADQSTAAMTVERATLGITNKIQEQQQALIKLESEYAKAAEGARTAFSALKDFMPRMSLENFQSDAALWQSSIDDLKKKAEALKVNLSVGVNTEETKAELAKIDQQIRFATEAEKAIKIKAAIETRQATLKEEEIRLGQVIARTFSVESEIGLMRISQAQSSRDQLLQIETQRLLAQRGLASVDAQEGVGIKAAAQIAANEVELEAYRAGLETKYALERDMTVEKNVIARELEMAEFTKRLENERTLAVDMELQKQLAIAQVKADAMSSDTAGGAGAANDVEMIQAQIKMQQLASLRENDKISEQQYQQELTAIKIQELQNRTAEEVMLNEQRQALLGTSPEAMAMALENEKLQAETEMLMLQEKLNGQMITEQEFLLMKEEGIRTSAERQSQIKEQAIQRDIEQNTRLRNNWQVTLGNIRLEQEKHGQMMGMIRGIQSSQEFAGAQGALSNLASLRSSSDRKAFEAGKAAAIAQSMTNTFMSATASYASMAAIPVIGPALGIAAAAAAIMAGMNNIAQIKSQKFQGGAAHGGIDEVPKSMNNSTFLLKAGERVVQPDQNKELGEAVDKINEGGAGGGHNISITIQGSASEDTVEKMKDAIINVLRESSERGVPIINERGIVRG